MGDRYPLLKFVIFSIVCVVFTLWLVMVIGNVPLAFWQGKTTYTAEFDDVTGLLVNDKVKIAGVDVGKVKGIDHVPGGGAMVTFEIDSDLRMARDSRIEVRWRDVFGLRFLYVVPGGGPELPNDDPCHSDDDVPCFDRELTANPANLADVLAELTPFLDALDADAQNEILTALEETFVGREGEIRELLTDGTGLLTALASRDDEIGSLLTNSATIFEAYAKRESQFRSLLDTFADVASTIAARNDELDAAVVELAKAQGELARLLEENDGDIRGALDEAEHIIEVLANNHANLTYILESGANAVVGYHRTSAFGQFFNIHAVDISINYQPTTFIGNRDAALPQSSYTIESEASTTTDDRQAMSAAFSPSAAGS
ncbi:MAG: MCE family protein [Nitriliruptorales bacterium]|nr:MCE family protein [Nitriliruptorales bacterium]